MLKRIVSELENVGTTFVLPLADTEAMQQLAQPLRSLVSIGVRPEFVIDACTKNPGLFRNLTTKGDDAWQKEKGCMSLISHGILNRKYAHLAVHDGKYLGSSA
ncbi:hypothetical protein TELCIR_11790 [Teladorsagia circumcincta]|uniref:Uncharacterized protein n=1 Tax=Teladorsagia circumcincta TaxID=45464 RepID=A0A2G9U8K1_TELCI|nr:hypothetical protein TELCIR_11790 [Teladorsagia circumcincta]